MKKIRILPALSLFVLLFTHWMPENFAQITPTEEEPALVRVLLEPDAVIMESIYRADFDVAYVGREGEGIHIVADAADMRRLEANNIPFEVMHWDLCAHYESRFDQSIAQTGGKSRGLGYGSMGGFFTYAEVEDKMDEWRNDYPDLVGAKINLGNTHQNREVWAFKVSDNVDVDEDEPEAIIDCLTHAREPQSMMTTLYFVNWMLENYPSDPFAKFLIENRELWVVPVHNPDGYERNRQYKPYGGGMWRKNRRNNGDGTRGVDPNRNWGYMWGYDNVGSSPTTSSDTYRGPYSMSEPITQALASHIEARMPKARMSIHTYGNYWLIPWGYDRIYAPDHDLLLALADEMAPPGYATGTPWEILYEVNGGNLDWDYGEHGIVSFTPEMGNGIDGFWPATNRIMPIAEENLPSMQYFLAIAGAYMRLQTFECTETAGKINNYLDAGDTVDLVVDVMNRGMVDFTGSVPVYISTSSPHIQIIDNDCQVPGMASRTCSNNAADPMSFKILSSAAYASTLTIDLEIHFNGYVQNETIDLVVGTPRKSICEDIEYEPYQWKVGHPSDTAQSGKWAWGDPCGTTQGNDTVQPEDDFSANGTHCFATDCGLPGQGPEDQDLDNGFTYLISPQFDLSDAVHPRLGFSYWWYKAADAGDLDRFTVTISNDGGYQWTNVDRIFAREVSEWTEVVVNIEDIIELTDRMKIRFMAMDIPDNSLLEALVDDIWIEIYSPEPLLTFFGELIAGDVCSLGVAWEPDYNYWIYVSPGKGPGVSLPNGTWYLDPPFFFMLYTGTLDARGRATGLLPVPDTPGIVGSTFYFQSFLIPPGGGAPLISNCLAGEVK